MFMNHNLPGGVELEAVFLPCTGVRWREDVICFNRREPVKNFVKEH